jgi:uncharacterized membrane protein
MTFMDDLTLVLDLLILVTVAVFYTGFSVWLAMRRNDRVAAMTHLRGGALLMGLLGVLIGAIALWGEFTWPINVTIPVNGTATNILGSYDLFFFDVLTMLALLLIAFAVAVYLKLPTHMVGILALVVGLGVIYYGYRGYIIPLTLDPLETFLLYLGFGGIAVLSFPVTLYVDWFVVGPSVPGVGLIPSADAPANPKLWTLILVVFLAVVVLSGIAALFYGFDSAWAHLASPP